MELIINFLSKFDHPFFVLLITIIGSIIFGYRASRDKANIIETLIYILVNLTLIICVGFFAYNADPIHFKNESRPIWSILGFSLALLVNGFVLLIMFLLYCHQNPQKFIRNNKIIFKGSYLFGALFYFLSFGPVFLGAGIMGFLEYNYPIRGIMVFLYLIPLILGFYLMGKSRQWLFRLMIFVIRRSLPENIQKNLVIERGKIELEEEKEEN